MLESSKFSEVSVLCIGDVMLDRFVAGHVKRISPEGPVPVMSVTSETLCPGGAANVARNIAALGAHCTLVGMTGLDGNGDTLTQLLTDNGGISTEFVTLQTRPTTTKTRFIGHNQQMLRVDHENASPISLEEEDRLLERTLPLIPKHHVVVLSDYAKGMLSESVVRTIIAESKRQNKPVIVDPKTSDFSRYAGAAIVTPNQKETQAVVDIWPETDQDAERAGQEILSRFDIESILVTRAERGMTFMDRNRPAFHIKAETREVFDVVGAGDTVIATLAVVLGSGASKEEASRIANTAAGIVVGKKGTATVSAGELHDALSHNGTSGAMSPTAKIYSWDEIEALSADWRNDGLKVGFTNGCFDILHVGHIRLLQFAREHCDRLVVGVNSDPSIKRLKGPTRPINSEVDRAELLGALSFVDAVVVFDEDTPFELIKTVSPGLLVKGADYTIDKIVGADVVLASGGEVLTFEIVAGKSTTATINRSQMR